MTTKLSIENSFCTFSDDLPQNISDVVKELLTYRNDVFAEKSQTLRLMSMAKSRGNLGLYGKLKFKLKQLQDNEYVCWFKCNSFPTGHLDMVKDLLREIAFNYELVDKRDKPNPDTILRWHNKPVKPRYFQEEVLKLALHHGRGVFELSVGAGKSLIMAMIIKELSITSLIVVPSSGLLEQLTQVMEDSFGSKYVQSINSTQVKKRGKLKLIRVVTIQTLAALQKAGLVQNLLSDVGALFYDEAHHSASVSYTSLLPEINHIYHRFSFSGTFLRNDSKTLDLWGFVGNKLYNYPPSRAIKEGFLTPLKVNIYSLEGKGHGDYKKEYDLNYCGNSVLLDSILDICMKHSKTSQILILVSRKDKSGFVIHDFLKSLGIENKFISGDDSKETIVETIDLFNSKKVNILIGSSVIGEGIDIRSTDHLIMAQGGKSEIAVVQAIGRAVRLSTGKKFAYVHDFRFLDTKYLNKHNLARIDMYKRVFDAEIIEC